MLQVCVCSLLMCPKIKNFHSGAVGLVLFSFLNRKFMYEVTENVAPESFTEHSLHTSLCGDLDPFL